MQGTKFTFADNLKQNLDQADGVADKIKNSIDEYIAKQGLAAPTEPRYQPVWQPSDEPRGLPISRRRKSRA